MAFAHKYGLFVCFAGILIGIFEQSQLVFQHQHPQGCLVDQRFGNSAGFHQRFEILDVDRGRHVNIHTGIHGKACRLEGILRNAVGNELLDGRPVGDENAVKAHLFAQNLPHQPGIGRGGHPIQGVEGGHHKGRTGVNGRLVPRQIVLAECPLGKLHGVVVSAAVRCAVPGKMLDTGGNLSPADMLPVLSLVAPHHGRCHQAVEIGVFSGGFHHSAPAGIPHQIDHRREGDVDAGGGGFPGGNGRTFLGHVRIEGAALGQGDGEHCAVAVDDVRHEQHGDMMGMVFHVELLNLGDLLCSDERQTASRHPDVLGADAHLLRRAGSVPSVKEEGRNLKQLADLFLQGQLPEKSQKFFLLHTNTS